MALRRDQALLACGHKTTVTEGEKFRFQVGTERVFHCDVCKTLQDVSEMAPRILKHV